MKITKEMLVPGTILKGEYSGRICVYTVTDEVHEDGSPIITISKYDNEDSGKAEKNIDTFLTSINLEWDFYERPEEMDVYVERDNPQNSVIIAGALDDDNPMRVYFFPNINSATRSCPIGVFHEEYVIQ